MRVDRVATWVYRAAIFFLGLWLGVMLEVLRAHAQPTEPIRCPNPCTFGAPGPVPTGATGVEWCAQYVDGTESTCSTALATPGAAAPPFVVDALVGRRYVFVYRWLGIASEWAALGRETYSGPGTDLTADGIQGMPDFTLWQQREQHDTDYRE